MEEVGEVHRRGAGRRPWRRWWWAAGGGAGKQDGRGERGAAGGSSRAACAGSRAGGRQTETTEGGASEEGRRSRDHQRCMEETYSGNLRLAAAAAVALQARRQAGLVVVGAAEGAVLRSERLRHHLRGAVAAELADGVLVGGGDGLEHLVVESLAVGAELQELGRVGGGARGKAAAAVKGMDSAGAPARRGQWWRRRGMGGGRARSTEEAGRRRRGEGGRRQGAFARACLKVSPQTTSADPLLLAGHRGGADRLPGGARPAQIRSHAGAERRRACGGVRRSPAATAAGDRRAEGAESAESPQDDGSAALAEAEAERKEAEETVAGLDTVRGDKALYEFEYNSQFLAEVLWPVSDSAWASGCSC